MVVTSYNRWPASRDPKAIGINPDWEPIRGHKFPGGCKAGDVETVFTYVVRQLDARVEPIDRDAIKDEWGWFYKMSANDPTKLSCHSSGTAFDYNATRHPNGHRGTFSAAQVREIRKILAECSGVIYWGGDRSHADEMHFEIDGSASEVKAAALRLRSPAPIPPAATPPPPIEEGPVYRIYVFKSGLKPAAAYRCLCAKAEGKDAWLIVSAWWIATDEEKATWLSRGLKQINQADKPLPTNPAIEFFNGPYDNTKTP